MENSLAGLSTLFSRVQRHNLWSIFPLKNVCLLSVLDIDQKILAILSNVSWQCCHNWVLHVHRNILNIIICFWKKYFITNFGQWAKIFRIFVQNFPVGSSKLLCTDPMEFFDFTFFPKEKLRYLFRKFSQNNSAVLRTCSVGFWKPQSMSP